MARRRRRKFFILSKMARSAGNFLYYVKWHRRRSARARAAISRKSEKLHYLVPRAGQYHDPAPAARGDIADVCKELRWDPSHHPPPAPSIAGTVAVGNLTRTSSSEVLANESSRTHATQRAGSCECYTGRECFLHNYYRIPQ